MQLLIETSLLLTGVEQCDTGGLQSIKKFAWMGHRALVCITNWPVSNITFLYISSIWYPHLQWLPRSVYTIFGVWEPW